MTANLDHPLLWDGGHCIGVPCPRGFAPGCHLPEYGGPAWLGSCMHLVHGGSGDYPVGLNQSGEVVVDGRPWQLRECLT